jgi:hypothetical protein
MPTPAPDRPPGGDYRDATGPIRGRPPARPPEDPWSSPAPDDPRPVRGGDQDRYQPEQRSGFTGRPPDPRPKPANRISLGAEPTEPDWSEDSGYYAPLTDGRSPRARPDPQARSGRPAQSGRPSGARQPQQPGRNSQADSQPWAPEHDDWDRDDEAAWETLAHSEDPEDPEAKGVVGRVLGRLGRLFVVLIILTAVLLTRYPGSLVDRDPHTSTGATDFAAPPTVTETRRSS